MTLRVVGKWIWRPPSATGHWVCATACQGQPSDPAVAGVQRVQRVAQARPGVGPTADPVVTMADSLPKRGRTQREEARQ